MKISKKMGKMTAVATAALGLSLGAASASADFIDGSISFSDGFATPPGLVSTDIAFDIDSANTTVTNVLGDFIGFAAPGQFVDSAGPIDTGAPGGTLYSVGGFTFSWGIITSDTNGALSCIGQLCTDTRALQITGTVSGNGFDATEFAANWTANGACAKDGMATACVDGTYSASWSSSVVALGIPPEVPAPGVLALMSIGLLGLAYQRRRKA